MKDVWQARLPRPRWPALTQSVKRATVSGRLLDELFPNIGALAVTYRAQSAEPLLPRGLSDPWLMGSAFDVWLQLQVAARPGLGAPAAGARRSGPAVETAWHELLDRLGPQPSTTQQWTGPSSRWDRTGLAQLSWAAAMLLVPYRRSGGVPAGSPLVRLPADMTGQDPLDLAPPSAVQELLQLAALADQRLLPTLRLLIGHGSAHPGARLTGSRWMPADVDLLCGWTLLEVKVETSRDTRTPSLVDPLRQLLGYLLHDVDDHYKLNAVGVYQARYGHLTTWPLSDLLPEAAGRPVDLAELGARWRAMLTAGSPAADSGAPGAGPGRRLPSGHPELSRPSWSSPITLSACDLCGEPCHPADLEPQGLCWSCAETASPDHGS